MTSPASDPSDEALAARAAAGEDAAFEALVTRYQHRVYRLACRLTSETDAPDILQETFLLVHRHLPAFRRESRFSTWLYRIATNAALMHRRAQTRRPTESLDALLPRFDEDGRHRQHPQALQVVSRVEELLDRQTLAREAQDAIDRLPDLYREAFVLRDLEQLPTGDVAEVLGVEPATVRQRVHRARLMMRGYLSHLVGVEP
jgi:RNA polymerase sigma-70 factor (ECF subfamily)